MICFAEQIKRHHSRSAELGDGDDVIAIRSMLEGVTIDRDQRIVKGIVTTDSPDLDDEVVVPDGLDMSYFPGRVKAVYLNHNYSDLPVATCRRLVKADRGMYCSTFITKRGIGDDLLTAIEEEAVRGFSIGFKVLEATSPSPEEQRRYGAAVDTVIRRAKLLEYSIVSMPANPDALMSLVGKSKIRRASAVAFGMPDSAERKMFRANPIRTIMLVEDSL